MKRVGLIAGLHTEAAIRYLRQFDEQLIDRFGVVKPVGVFMSSVDGRAFETAMTQRDAAQVQGLCLEAAQQCAAAGAEVLLLGNSQLHVAGDLRALVVRGCFPSGLKTAGRRQGRASPRVSRAFCQVGDKSKKVWLRDNLITCC